MTQAPPPQPVPEKKSNTMWIILGVVGCGCLGVFAIGGILAAIAVPNFISAQSRVKVATANAEMRNLAVALESYYIDHNSYPLPERSGTTVPWYEGDVGVMGHISRALTTPIFYTSSLPDDPFVPESPYNDWTTDLYRYGTSPQTFWFLYSMGPDQDYDTPADLLESLDQMPISFSMLYSHNGGPLIVYDPSNGTTSNGDIYRFGP